MLCASGPDAFLNADHAFKRDTADTVGELPRPLRGAGPVATRRSGRNLRRIRTKQTQRLPSCAIDAVLKQFDNIPTFVLARNGRMINQTTVLNHTESSTVTLKRACQQGVDLGQREGCVYAGLREFGTVIIAPEVRMNPQAHLDDEGIMRVGQESKKSAPCSSFPVDCRYRSHPPSGVFPGDGLHPRDGCRGLGRLRPHQVSVEAGVPRGLEEWPTVDGRAGSQRQSLRLETFDTRR